MEVVILACSRVDGRGSHDLGDGSGTCFGEVLASSDLSVSILAMVAVYLSFSERYLGSFELVGLVILKGSLTFLAIPKTTV